MIDSVNRFLWRARLRIDSALPCVLVQHNWIDLTTDEHEEWVSHRQCARCGLLSWIYQKESTNSD